MKKSITFCLLLLFSQAPTFAQYESDTESIDTTIETLYAVISGEAGETRDWDRFRNLFIPEAKLMPTGLTPEGVAVYRSWSPDQYIELAGASLERDGFFEKELHREVEQFRGVAHVFSTYISMRTAGGEVFARGINSIQLFYDNERWWVVNIFWAGENPTNPIPDKYLGDNEGWVSLFDGESLNGWKAGENPETFRVEDGMIVANGKRAHLFYQGEVGDHNFTDFEFRAEVMTTPNSNSGIYFHTKYQEAGWPGVGYESQVNNSYDVDPRRTASLYGVDDNTEITFPDNEWMDYYIKVQGKRILIKINGQIITDYTEPEGVEGSRKLSSGTIALQGHDANSKVFYRNIYVRQLD